MPIRRELIDELLKDYENPQAILGEDSLLKELSKAVIERALEAKLDTHLGYRKHSHALCEWFRRQEQLTGGSVLPKGC
jgi:putative transposase